MGAVALNDNEALFKLGSDFEHAVAVLIIEALNKVHSAGAGLKTNFERSGVSVKVAPFKSKEVTVSGKRTGIAKTAFDELQCAGDCAVGNCYGSLEVALLEFSPREGRCISLGGNCAAT